MSGGSRCFKKHGRGWNRKARAPAPCGAALQCMVRVKGTGPGAFFRWDLKPGTYTLGVLFDR